MLVPATGQEADKTGDKGAEPVVVDPIPQTFEAWRDEAGFSWQVNRVGALGSGEIPYFQSAMAVFVNGAPLATTRALRPDGGAESPEGAHVVLEGTAGELSVMRDVWLDAKRSGVRLLDLFKNTGQRKASFRIDLKSGYQYPWQDLHGTGGNILGANPGEGMGPHDFGVVVKFSQTEGRHDTLFVTSGERDALRPAIAYASNLRELTFTYELEIDPGKTAALLHWVAQRNLRSAPDAAEALRPFYQRRRLLDSRVPENTFAEVRNFDADTFPAPGAEPPRLEALFSLNALLEREGIDRRGEDTIWISEENQLTGEVNAGAKLKVETVFGPREAGIGQVAAILGGGGIGRRPRVFLRDGRVWTGALKAENLTIKIAEGWNVEELQPEEMGLLVLRVGAGDGKPVEGAAAYVETRNGDVWAVKAPENAALKFLSPWGELAVPLGEVRQLSYATIAAPKYRLLRSDGSRLTVMLSGDPLGFDPAPSGEPFQIAAVDVAGVWNRDEDRLFGNADLDEDWFELADAAIAGGPPESAVLLRGNNLISGAPAPEPFHLVSGSAVTPLNAAETVAIRQSIVEGEESDPVFEVEMTGGEILTGRIRESMITIESGGKRWPVPVQQFVAFERRVAAP
ncbi:MAG: hypothetical protein KDM91_18375 [Verrucomicrobiae bacterium]|nr:hypothetical protein [Verrucomicrobiae bacterium]